MRIYIIDDEIQAQETLMYYLREFFPEIEILGSAVNIHAAGRAIFELKPDLVFLDISMPGGSGFELLEINDLSKTLVVFVTAHSEHAIEAIKKDAFDYLLKPLQINELTRVINKARKKIEAFQIRDIELLKIKIKLDGKVLLLDPAEIIYITSEGNYSTIFLNSSKTVFISKNMKKMEEEYFSGFPFFRVHQSYIVNINKVAKYDATTLELLNEMIIPIAKTKLEQFRIVMSQI